MRTIITMAILIASILCNSQDLIIKKNGDEIKCNVSEVGTEEVKYKKLEGGPLYVINKNEIFIIKYSNGNKDVFNDEPIQKEEHIEPTPISNPDANNMYSKGLEDGLQYYTAKNCGSGGTFATTILVSPILGLIPAISCSSTPPKEINLGIPDQTLANNNNYMRGYKESALKIKKKQVWSMFGFGVAVDLAIILLVATAL